MRQQLENNDQLEVFIIDNEVLYAKPIANYENYAVSTTGEVINVKSSQVLKPYKNSSGYLRVNLNGAQLFVHRLVAAAYLDGTASLDKKGNKRLQVNHINGCKEDNRIRNLEYVSATENHQWNKVIKAARAERFKQLIDMCEQFVYVGKALQL